MFFSYFYEYIYIYKNYTAGEVGLVSTGRSCGSEEGEQAFHKRYNLISPQFGLSVHPVHKGNWHLRF